MANYKHLHLYQKSEVLVLLTGHFCRRFLPSFGDRTVDQMNQAARSGKQNIVEGSEAAMTSSETEVKLINVARASLQELRDDYQDYLKKALIATVGQKSSPLRQDARFLPIQQQLRLLPSSGRNPLARRVLQYGHNPVPYNR